MVPLSYLNYLRIPTLYLNPFNNIKCMNRTKKHSSSPEHGPSAPKTGAAQFGKILEEPAMQFPENVRIREIAERQLLYDVAELTSRVRSEDLSVALTGGLATRAYTGPIRFTHDADLVVSEKSIGRLKRILKDMGYRGSRHEFGKGEILFATKHFEDRRKGIAYTVKLDISIGGIYDHSSGIHYPMSERLIAESRNLPIRGYFPTSSSVLVTAQVIGLEDLFLLKTMTVATPNNGREKDTIDALLLILKNPPDLLHAWGIAKEVGIAGHISANITNKLIAYLTNPNTAMMRDYGISFTEAEREYVNSYLVSLQIHRELGPHSST